MLTAGIDLAAEPKGTALSVIDWSGDHAKLVSVATGLNDAQLIRGCLGAEKIGIDCALGWPIEFVEFLSQQAESLDGPIDGGLDWRRRIAFRETDRVVREVTGRWPLSVATDRLGMTALRCSGLLSKMHKSGIEVDRSGAGTVVEIYPAASLRIWGFSTSGYRNSVDLRKTLLAEICSHLPSLDLNGHEELLSESCDAFDSLVASLATRGAALGFYEGPAPEMVARAKMEGWIALPNRPLSELFSA